MILYFFLMSPFKGIDNLQIKEESWKTKEIQWYTIDPEDGLLSLKKEVDHESRMWAT